MSNGRGWQDLDEKEVDIFLRALEREGIEHRIRNSSHRVCCRGLCFYAHGALYRVTRRQPRPEDAVQWYFSDGTQLHRMDGTLAALNKANQRGQLILNVDNVADYLKFVLFFTMGRDLDMHIVETPAHLGLDTKKLDEGALADLAGVLQPVMATGHDPDDDEFALQAHMMSHGELFFTEFTVTARGQLSMTYIDEAGVDLPDGAFLVPDLRFAGVSAPLPIVHSGGAGEDPVPEDMHA